MPVVWVQHHDAELPRGSDAWQLVEDLDPAGSEPLVEKRYGDAFEDTSLEQVLADTNPYWTHQEAPGRTAGTLATSDVAF